ncbi:MAG: para-aminobenzoate synthetase component I PabB [Idiomarinaceae bacterium HL-53]|nr:MAG: para-aminobenzoate synthetase component I PabB [Idiomarinaceae bacterium HL-53]CUS48671.1 aminodeoxychorismate synthase, subunit I [Idiomarinaceae bacterium HL-53]
MLFDSAESTHPDSRFDIIVRQPSQTLTCEKGLITVSTPTGDIEKNYSGDFFSQLQQATTAVAPLEVPHLPFTGGALGYLGYDMAREIEKLPTTAKDDISLPDACFGIYERALVIDHQLKTVTAIGPTSSSAEIEMRFWQTPYEVAADCKNFKLISPWHSNLDEQEYNERLASIKNYLEAGDCYQINFAQRFEAKFEGSAWQAYQLLRSANKAPFSGYIQLPDTSILSVSPERFVRVDNKGQIQTRPIKGTRPRGQSTTQDQVEQEALLTSEKDRAENLMIVDLLRNDISRVCEPGTVRVPELFKLESFPAVHHLVSTVEGTLKERHSSFDLMRAIFPGGSITGAPKIRAMEIIEQLEPHRRKVYCGSFAYFSSHGHADSSITIRTLCAANNTLYCWAGGGIVIDSITAHEYAETYAKVARILPILSASEHIGV